MDWTSVIMTLLSTTSIAGAIGSIVYFRENKKLKKNEVTLSSVEAQRQEIELAEMYKDKMLDMMEQLSQKQNSSNDNQSRILKKLDVLDVLDGRMDKVEGKISDIVTYLNGDFQEYLRRQNEPKPRKPRQPRK